MLLSDVILLAKIVNFQRSNVTLYILFRMIDFSERDLAPIFPLGQILCGKNWKDTVVSSVHTERYKEKANRL